MLRANYRCFETFNICVDIAKCVENVQTFILYTHFWTVTKNDLTWQHNLIMARFQLISMSSYAKNKLQMCSVTQRQCRRRQICRNFSQISPVHSLCVFCKKMTCLDWTIYSWQGLNSFVCPPMQRTIYRAFQSLNISVDVIKFVEMLTNSPSTLTFCSSPKMIFLDWTIYSWQGFNWIGCPLMLGKNIRCFQ